MLYTDTHNADMYTGIPTYVRVYAHVYACTGFPGGTAVKNAPARAGGTRDAGSIHGMRRSPEEEMATHSSILA